MRTIALPLAAVFLSLVVSSQTLASEVSILDVKLEQKRSGWNVRVTLKHADSGWDHYADGWRVVSDTGQELGKRVLYHPHVHEQPFTRSLANLQLDEDKHKIIYIEAHDSVSGWSTERLRIDLQLSQGDRFQIFR